MQTTQNYSLKKPEGTDVVNINDLNDNMDVLDGTIYKMSLHRSLTLTAAGWSTSYPYTQTVQVPGITAEDSIKFIGVKIPENATLDQVKACNKAAGYLMYNPGGVGAGPINI